MPLTADEAYDLAKLFSDVGADLMDYHLQREWGDDEIDQKQKIEDLAHACKFTSMDLINKAVGLSLERAGTSLTALKSITAEAKAAISRIKTVEGCIKLATGFVGLAGKIFSGNVPDAVKAALNQFATICNGLTAEGKDPQVKEALSKIVKLVEEPQKEPEKVTV
jgi:hypothetical protein